MSSWRPAGAIGSVTFKEFSHLWEFFFYVIAQAHDYRLGHGQASLTAPLVLNVIPLRVLTAAVLLCKYKYLRNRILHVIAQVHDYRLGHGKASFSAPLVLNVISLRVMTAAVLLCKYKNLRN